jgi:membrane protease subunit (stomatin/prohibitin family)
LKNWDKAFKSPFKSEVYFFSTREQIDQRWGTPQAVTVRDKEFGPIRLRAFGTYSYKIDEPTTFYQKISGTRDAYTAAELDGQLTASISTTIATTFGKADTPFLDMAANQTELSNKLKVELDAAFYSYGLKLCTFMVQSVTLPEELQEYLDKRSSISLVGDLNKYAQFQAADSISKAAENTGGMAGAFVGMNAGALMGQTFQQNVQQPQNNTAKQDADPFELLEKLGSLLAKGLITQEEYDAKKAELLKRIS